MDYNPKNLQSVLVYMRERFGAGIFEEPPRMYAILRDLAPGLERDENVLRQMSERGRLRELRQASESGAEQERARATAKSRNWLTDYLMLSEAKADYFLTALQAAYGLEPPPQPVPPPQIQPPQPEPATRRVTRRDAEPPTQVRPAPKPQFVKLSQIAPTQYVKLSQIVPPPQRVNLSKPAPQGVTQAKPAPQVRPSGVEPQVRPSGGGITRSGRTGECAWTLDGADVFTVSGQGRMGAYSIGVRSPWWDDRERIRAVIIRRGVTSIGDGTFEGCKALTSVTIPDSVASIKDNAFSGCVGLTKMMIPNSVTSIESWAFSGCSGLTALIISRRVTSVKCWTFAGCVGLQSLNIPRGVTEIKSYAFAGCAGLKVVTIPDSVTAIRHWAFEGCDSLHRVSVPKRAAVDPDAFPPHTQILRR